MESYDQGAGLFRIIYTDGDSEEMEVDELLQCTAPDEPGRPRTEPACEDWKGALADLAAVAAVNIEHQIALCYFTQTIVPSTRLVSTLSDEELALELVQARASLTIPEDDRFWAVESPSIHRVRCSRVIKEGHEWKLGSIVTLWLRDWGTLVSKSPLSLCQLKEDRSVFGVYSTP